MLSRGRRGERPERAAGNPRAVGEEGEGLRRRARFVPVQHADLRVDRRRAQLRVVLFDAGDEMRVGDAAERHALERVADGDGGKLRSVEQDGFVDGIKRGDDDAADVAAEEDFGEAPGGEGGIVDVDFFDAVALGQGAGAREQGGELTVEKRGPARRIAGDEGAGRLVKRRAQAPGGPARSARRRTTDRAELGPIVRIDGEGGAETDDDAAAERREPYELEIGQPGEEIDRSAESGMEGGDQRCVGGGVADDGFGGAGKREASAREGLGRRGFGFDQEHAGARVGPEIARMGGEAADVDDEGAGRIEQRGDDRGVGFAVRGRGAEHEGREVGAKLGDQVAGAEEWVGHGGLGGKAGGGKPPLRHAKMSFTTLPKTSVRR